MDADKATVGLIKFTLTIVVLLGVVVLLGIKSPIKLSTNIEDIGRSPASKISYQLDSGEKVKLPNMISHQLECVRPGKLNEVQSSAKQMRLMGRHCNGYSDLLKKGSIVNRTNGFKASFFLTKKNAFSSDYIYLAEGTNEILLTLETESGEKILSNLQIERVAKLNSITE